MDELPSAVASAIQHRSPSPGGLLQACRRTLARGCGVIPGGHVLCPGARVSDPIPFTPQAQLQAPAPGQSQVGSLWRRR